MYRRRACVACVSRRASSFVDARARHVGDAVASTRAMRATSELEVVVHPLVLLSVVDHFRRCDEVREGRSDGWLDG